MTASHVYAAAGSYTPQVVLKDEAGNVRQVAAQAVTVQRRHRAARGQGHPAQEGGRRRGGLLEEAHRQGHRHQRHRRRHASPSSAIEKRGTGWYFYKATTKTWLKAATKAKAWKRAKAAVADPTAKGDWVVRLAGLKQGTLFVRATATDLAGNVSKPVTHKAVLTAP